MFAPDTKLEKDRLEVETKRIGGLIKGATFSIFYDTRFLGPEQIKIQKFTENVMLLKSENPHFTKPCIILI